MPTTPETPPVSLQDLAQPGILAPLPPFSRYLTFVPLQGGDPRQALARLQAVTGGDDLVVGLGQMLVSQCGGSVPGLRPFTALVGPGVTMPATPAALWLWLRGHDKGVLFRRGRELERLLQPAFAVQQVVDGFQFDAGRDLSGYEDGTENPQGSDAVAAALLAADQTGLHGSSFVAVQQWQHRFEALEERSEAERDDLIGRHHADNAEFDEAPPSAHVKRTAQESFTPPAFILRRSMPWVLDNRGGLMFVAFGRSFDAFEVLARRMVGLEDGVTDGLFAFTQPLTGSYFWCPPVQGRGGRLDLTLLGMG